MRELAIHVISAGLSLVAVPICGGQRLDGVFVELSRQPVVFGVIAQATHPLEARKPTRLLYSLSHKAALQISVSIPKSVLGRYSSQLPNVRYQNGSMT